MNRDFIGALLQLNAEKNIPREQLVATLADAIQSAYRRTAPGNENVYVDVDPDSGKFNAYRAMVVVDEIEDETMEFTVDDAKKYKTDAKVGDLIKIDDLDPSSFGRIHAQMATQLVRQRLREVEREQVFGQYAQRESEIITGTVSRVEPRGVILDVGRAEAILPVTDQSATEHYRIGQHVKAYVLEVRRTTKGPLIYVSRTHKNFLRRLFELEVPEIHAGTVEIKAIAREAGSRSKVAVSSRQEGLDPVGATVGQRGGRVQAVVAELGGEKIDIIPWHEDPAVFVANASVARDRRERHDRRGEPHRQRNRARADAFAGHWPRGPERPTRGEAHGLAHRHPLRPGGTARSCASRRAARPTRTSSQPVEAEAAAEAPAEEPAKPKRTRGDQAKGCRNRASRRRGGRQRPPTAPSRSELASRQPRRSPPPKRWPSLRPRRHRQTPRRGEAEGDSTAQEDRRGRNRGGRIVMPPASSSPSRCRRVIFRLAPASPAAPSDRSVSSSASSVPRTAR